MDLKIIAKSLREAFEDKDKIELLKDVERNIKLRGIVVSDVKKFFEQISVYVLDRNKEIVDQSLAVLSVIIDSEFPELELEYPIFFRFIIRKLEDTDMELREKCVGILKKYVKRTRNLEKVLAALSKFGLRDDSWRLRLKVVKYLPSLFECEKTIFNVPSGIPEIKKVTEDLIVHLSDESLLVQKESEKTLWILWKSYDGFETIVRRLARDHQAIFQKRVVENTETKTWLKDLKRDKQDLKQIPAHESVFKLNVGLMGLEGNGITTKLKTGKALIGDWPLNRNNLFFGFITQQEMKMLLSEDWNIRLEALEIIISKLKRTREYFDLNSYLSSFCKFVIELLHERHFKLLLTVFDIVDKLMDIPGIANKTPLNALLHPMVEFLGDNKVVIRKEAFPICKKICDAMRPEMSVYVLKKYLNDDSWHVREEVLQLISLVYLNDAPSEHFDEEGLLKVITKLVDDKIPKVRNAAIECLTVISFVNKKLETSEILQGLLDPVIYNTLTDLIQNFKVAYEDNGKLVHFNKQQYEYFWEMSMKRQNEDYNIRIQDPVTMKEEAEHRHEKDGLNDSFDYEQFVLKDPEYAHEDEEGENKSDRLDGKAIDYLVKDPKYDLKERVEDLPKSPMKFISKNTKKIIDINTKVYSDYRFEGDPDEKSDIYLFSDQVPLE